jgi:signal peptidase II
MECLIAGIVVLLDWGSKEWVKVNLPLGVSKAFIPGIFQLHYTQNTGAAFSILSGQRWLLSALAIVAALLLYFFRQRITEGKTSMKIVLGLVLGGTLGNLIDRLCYGYVIDFLEFSFIRFPVFNIADSALSIGVSLMVLMLLLEFKKEGLHDTPRRS